MQLFKYATITLIQNCAISYRRHLNQLKGFDYIY
jgi:hypothetical protein